MRRNVKLLILSIVVALPIISAKADDSPATVAAALATSGLNDTASYSILQSLTSEIGPRLAGTEAMARAASWGEVQLKAAGLDNVHREAFPMTAWIRGAETSQVLTPSPQNLAITALGGSVATPSVGIDADIALFPTYEALLAAPVGSLKGKIAVVTQRMVRAQDGSGYGAANPIRHAGPSEAAKRGAVAYLLRSLGTDHHRLPHTGKLDYQDGIARIPAAALSSPDADQLELLAAKGPVKLHLLLRPTENPAAQSWNIVGEIKGRESPDQIVLIGAHLDSWDLGTGATDDGAGIAIVTAAGKLIAALPRHPKRTIRVVMFGAEEMDYSGKAYAKAHIAEAPYIVVAGETDFGARRVLSAQLPAGFAASDFGHSFGSTLIPLGALLSPAPAQFGGSDIEELAAAGVPFVSMRQDGLDYFDTHHTADDTLDKVDPKELAQDVGVWASFAYLAAETGVDFRVK